MSRSLRQAPTRAFGCLGRRLAPEMGGDLTIEDELMYHLVSCIYHVYIVYIMLYPTFRFSLSWWKADPSWFRTHLKPRLGCSIPRHDPTDAIPMTALPSLQDDNVPIQLGLSFVD